MKAFIGVVTFGVMLSVLTGCEGGWQFGGSAGNFNESGKWQDVSGTYVGASGSFLVSDYSNMGPTNGTGNTVSETIGVTVAGQTLYSGTLGSAPLTAGTLTLAISSIAAGTDNGSGSISGTGITSGSINYSTGAWSLTLTAAPPAGADILATYQKTSGTAGAAGPGGSGVVINTFTVQQSGNVVSFTDNNGSIYKGNIGMTSTNTGGTNLMAISMTYAYDVSGVSAAGFNVEMVGTFLINGATVNTNGNIITSTVISGTWLEQGGKTGHIRGVRQY
ncbi:MAG: hypothetical protein EPN23_06905 [Verrucomicrobia bacterium]|nr:MAG: hypothetical protein EPN23_06905 [Verrucomicrobiota bacterium]